MNRSIHNLLSLSHENFGEWVKMFVNAALERVESDGEQ